MKRHDPSTKDRFEVWLGKHNRKLEFIRTAIAAISTMLTALVFLRIFEVI
jgi:hypothetical protein